MSNPLALFPLALAAGGGRIEAIGADGTAEYEAQQLVAAGLTLLQRSAPLVRALSGKRSAILLPVSPHFLTALAASDGRAAVLIDTAAPPSEIAFQCADAGVGAVFTTLDFATRLPDNVAAVFLDDAPRTTRVVSDGRAQVVDLGSHHGLSLAGERDVDGRDEEAVVIYSPGRARMTLTHANLIANARSLIAEFALSSRDRVLVTLPLTYRLVLGAGLCAPLLAGASVRIVSYADLEIDAHRIIGDATALVGEQGLVRV